MNQPTLYLILGCVLLAAVATIIKADKPIVLLVLMPLILIAALFVLKVVLS